eukprot:CAMPEP_0177772374 /NCGR_PEP_ID=MMETSP0491_2-20121128/12189_1 /TAXON_ID=63592 /ORGANISM="Tetraselmis chuii, Strain PLY429" /LENGTH=46 /DNA_ID= /DNA_START= /DNA_END= /DNA_ORIENTATION=
MQPAKASAPGPATGISRKEGWGPGAPKADYSNHILAYSVQTPLTHR